MIWCFNLYAYVILINYGIISVSWINSFDVVGQKQSETIWYSTTCVIPRACKCAPYLLKREIVRYVSSESGFSDHCCLHTK